MPAYTRNIRISAQRLHFPVKNGAPICIGRLYLAGQVVREFIIELATEGQVGWWAFYDVSQFKAQELTLTLEGDDLEADQFAFLDRSIQQADALLDAHDLYQEKHRPQFHFTSQRGWNNDPNGLVYSQGTWHLFYQHNPFGVSWGNMHWGHATSSDLVHWEEKPTALYQRSLQDMAFSGGGVLDPRNTAGFQTLPEPAQSPVMLLSFTSTGRGECLAYSQDGGNSFIDYAGNPVLSHQGRDPKIIWYEPAQKWVMIVYEEVGEARGYALYDSPDLKRWNRLQFMPGYFECPELFELPVDGDPQNKKWVIVGCTWQGDPSAFLVGSFDGDHFVPESEPGEAHYGPQFYASQIFSHAPESRRIMLGWLRGASYPDMPFSQGMSLPLELSLRSTGNGLRLCFYPVQELDTLRKFTVGFQSITLEQANDALDSAKAELLDIHLQIIPDQQETLRLDVRGQCLTFDPIKSTLEFAGKVARVSLRAGLLDIRLLVDRSVVEVFAARGEAAFATMNIPSEGQEGIHLDGCTQVQRLTIHSLGSIWN